MGEAYKPCDMRRKVVMFGADGGKSHVYRCTEQTAEKANTDVSEHDCSVCTVREAVLVRISERQPKFLPPTGCCGG